MSVKYDVMAQINPAKAVPAIGEAIDAVNSSIKSFSEDLPAIGLRSTIKIAELTVSEPMNDSDKDKARAIIEEQFHTALPAWELQVMDFRKHE